MEKKTALSLVVAIILGIAVGYFLQGFLRRGTVTITDPGPVIQGGSGKKEYTPEQLKGWCCTAPGQCVASASDEACLGAQGGLSFAYDEADCQIVCAPAAQ